ncbi:hypothetical protein AB6A23_23765 [Paenibacillus tarimensis]
MDFIEVTEYESSTKKSLEVADLIGDLRCVNGQYTSITWYTLNVTDEPCIDGEIKEN